MLNSLSRAEIMIKIPKLKRGSFEYFARTAGIFKIGKRQNKSVPHITENLYPIDSVRRIKAVMPGRK